MSKKNGPSRGVDLGAAQERYETAEREQKLAAKAYERAQQELDAKSEALTAARTSLDLAARSVLGKA